MREFREACGRPCPEEPTGPEARVASMHLALVREECFELAAAEATGDPIGVADALADIVYVVYDMALALGVDSRSVGRGVPHLRWPIGRLVVALRAALEIPAPLLAQPALAGLVAAAKRRATAHGIDLAAVFFEVHRSNMTKLGRDGKPVLRADGKVLKGPDYEPPDLRTRFAERFLLDVRRAA